MKAITQGAYNLQQQGADSIQPLSPQGHYCRYLEKKIGNSLNVVDSKWFRHLKVSGAMDLL